MLRGTSREVRHHLYELKQRSGHQYDVACEAQIEDAMRFAFSEFDPKPFGLLRFDVFSIGC